MGLRGPVTDAQREDLAASSASQRHLLALINDMLNFARLEAGQVEFELADVAGARRARRRSRRWSRRRWRAKGTRLRRAGAATATLRVRADREKLQQVLLNLLTNADQVHATPGGRVRRCACDARRRTASCSPRERHGRRDRRPTSWSAIFEPFVQVDRHAHARRSRASGLGLAISRDLARAMGGELTATSAPGVGSTFVARIPRAS